MGNFITPGERYGTEKKESVFEEEYRAWSECVYREDLAIA